ncbi:MAG: hypothetical protein K0R57_5254 [Paenibacillaceae bacterium]|jgi:hypothetical protein|nr:hypothetical protein [Paenibacillaceae bacterium]
MGAVEWMQQGPFGLMVHYLKQTLPREGAAVHDWNEAVDRFPVKAFCREVEGTGAGWLIFTIGQNNGFYCSPNPVLEQWLPGRCSRRDLILEIAMDLKRRGIRFLAYLPAEVDTADEALREALGWDLHPADKTVFQERYMRVIEAWAQRFGTCLDGWWFDGCYNSGEKSFMRTHQWTNDRFDYARWAKACRAGNPAAVISMNPGADAMKIVFPDQDYLGGETNKLEPLPDGPQVDGMQWHALTWLDCFWIHEKRIGPIDPPRFSDEELYRYLSYCRSKGGAVTLNAGIYQDGALAEATAAQLRRVSKLLLPDAAV